LESYLKKLEQIVNIDSGSYCKEGIKEVVNFVKQEFKGWDIQEKNKDSMNPILVIENKNIGPKILLAGHLDTVFPEGTVEKRPFKVEDEIAYGAGVADMKSGILSLIRVAKDLTKVGVALRIILNTDEEISSPYSKDYIVEACKDTKFAYVFEPARKNGNLVIERKGIAKYRVVIEGKSSHAGINPELGISSIHNLGVWINKLTSLIDLEAGNSINIGLISGGSGVNVVADKAEFTFESRTMNKDFFPLVEKILNNIKIENENKGLKITIEKIGYRPPMRANENTEILKKSFLEEAEKLNIKIGFESTGGGSDANFIADYGIPVIDGVGPIGGNAHSKDEYLNINSISERIELVKNVILNLV
jgi:glutamate carboxypeptidase